MAITFDTKYPTALKNAAWQKKKSFKDKAKAKTKTGLGQTLLDAEAAWKAIVFDRLIATKQGVGPNTKRPLENLKAIRSQTEDYLNNASLPVQKAIAALDKAASRARTTAKNTALSDTARKAATALSGQLIAQAKLLRDIKLDDFDAVIVRLDVNLNRVEGQHREMLQAMDSVVDMLRDEQTVRAWEKANAGEYLEEGVKVSQLLAQRTGDTDWAKIHKSWRQLLVAFAGADRKVKTLSPQFAAEVISEYADLVEKTFGSII